MTRFALMFVTLMLLSVAGCARLLVETDYDHNRDFSGYHTWSWAANAGTEGEAIDPMVRTAIERALSAKAMTMVEEGADLEVDYTLSKVEHTASSTPVEKRDMGQRVGNRQWAGQQRAHTWSYEEGSLSLFISDAASGDVVWSGVAKEVVDPRRTEAQRQDLANRAVQKLLDGFPPTR